MCSPSRKAEAAAVLGKADGDGGVGAVGLTPDLGVPEVELAEAFRQVFLGQHRVAGRLFVVETVTDGNALGLDIPHLPIGLFFCHWKNKEDAIAQMKAPLPLVDILKVSDEELPLLTGTTDCESGTAQLAQNGIRLIFVTLGANGVFYRFGDKTGHVAGVPCKVGDTNGAGDTFFGAALSKLCKEELDTLTVDKLEGILAFANKAASITTSRHGAIPAMPTLAEVEG